MKWLPGKFLDFWFRRCGSESNSQEIIKNTKCPVLIFSRKRDTVIPEEAQLKISDKIIPKEKFRLSGILEHDPERNVVTKIFTLTLKVTSYYVMMVIIQGTNLALK
ncbi:MAG: hypothetical protein PG981_001217 [Wolbachia endosymbiont of Ctenocephalides orientis wCori]|nr:MAG: hypothetical protein PG981_001217 [Wolbachia endosymbiont of Ctenocephalides orientis wCori]